MTVSTEHQLGSPLLGAMENSRRAVPNLSEFHDDDSDWEYEYHETETEVGRY